MKNEEAYLKSLTYADISRALSRDFLRVFCVNTDTDCFIEYKPHEKEENLDILTSGEDFRDVLDEFLENCYSEDFDTFRTAVRKDNILNVLATDRSFCLDYRMMIGGKATYVKLKGVRLDQDDPSHILFGLSNMDKHMKRLARYEKSMENSLTYESVAEALASDYFCIYYVDLETGQYKEYKANETYKKLGVKTTGDDYFTMMRGDLSDMVVAEDRDAFLLAFDKENLTKVLSADRLFVLTFRVMYNEKPVYIRMKVTKMAAEDDHHVVIGMSNVDAHMKRLENYQKMENIAYRDPLTGVKSKQAYVEAEKMLDDKLKAEKKTDLAVVVCDVNGLKKINDTQGHKAGDEYICRSCKMICDVFSHSPVYRVGGDEFVAILQGEDYENRNELIRELHDRSASNISSDGAVVSGGLAVYEPDQDRCVKDIFDRADSDMYIEKALLKSLGATTRDDESDAAEEDLENVPVINPRKHILIADDLKTNRELLGNFLEDDYDILYASDGVETLKMLREHKDEIALLLLDLYMPNMTGREVIREMQIDVELMSIPVIMLTVDHEAELDSLRIGAMDFISKPYPDIEIVKTRIAKCIELSEDRYLIQHTQRDKLTDLYNPDYFRQYVERFDHQYKQIAFDAIVCDIKQFRSVNEKYGRQFGDLVLRSIGKNFKRLARRTGGIGCRQGVDTFLLYCPHQDDYEQLITKFKTDLLAEEELADKVDLRFGVFANAKREPDVEERFACAKKAADKTANDPEKICGYYIMDTR